MTDRQLGATAAVAAVFDRVAASYETVGPPFFDHVGPLLVEHADVRRGDRVVDLAAGSGSVSIPALSAAGPGGSLLAVDLAEGMVQRLAARLAGSGHQDARVAVGDISQDLALASASVDVVLCGFALFFLPDPPAALRSWRALLRPGGRLAVSTWGREDVVFGALRDQLRTLGVDSRPRGEAYDDPDVLRAALLDAGLVDVGVTTVAVNLTLTGVDELLAWGRTHGVRGWLDQLDADATAGLRATLLARWPSEIAMTWQAHLAAGRQA